LEATGGKAACKYVGEIEPRRKEKEYRSKGGFFQHVLVR